MKRRVALWAVAAWLPLAAFAGGFADRHAGGRAENPAEVWRTASLGALRIGGVLGERIGLTVDGNMKKVDYDKVFVEPFRRKDGKKTFVGTGNVVEALVLLSKQTGDEELRAIKDRLVGAIVASQEPDGYIGCLRPEQRVWRAWDCEDVGFLLDGLVLDYVHFGNRTSLDAAVRAADWMLAHWRNPPKDCCRFIYDKELFMGLAHGIWSLYDVTRDVRYKTFLCETFDYLNWDMPIVLGRDIGLKGHACGYLDTCYAQLAMYRTLGDRRLLRQTSRFLEHYLHGDGGLISGLEGVCECMNDAQEGAGCVGETCMSSYLIYTMDLALRTGAVAPALAGDIIERALYNGFFAAQSRDGRRIRYYTPLEGVRCWWPSDDYCCPVNFRRAMGHVPALLLYTNASGILANVYSPMEGAIEVKGARIGVREETDYPSSGKIRFVISPDREQAFSFSLRIPGWCDRASVKVNGSEVPGAKTAGSLFVLERTWRKSDVVEVDFPMGIRVVRGRKRQSGRCAFMRGPLVYALDIRPFSSEGLHKEERENSMGAKSPDLLVVWPDTAELVRDDRARTGGTAIRVKGTLESSQLGPECEWVRPIDFVFTEFPDPANTLTYFRVPESRNAVVEDTLFVPCARGASVE